MQVNCNLWIILLFLYKVCCTCTTNSVLDCGFNMRGIANVTCSNNCLHIGVQPNSYYYCSLTSSNAKSNSIRPNVGVIVGAFFGTAAFLIFSFVFIFWKLKRDRKSKNPTDITPLSKVKQESISEKTVTTEPVQTTQSVITPRQDSAVDIGTENSSIVTKIDSILSTMSKLDGMMKISNVNQNQVIAKLDNISEIYVNNEL